MYYIITCIIIDIFNISEIYSYVTVLLQEKYAQIHLISYLKLINLFQL